MKKLLCLALLFGLLLQAYPQERVKTNRKGYAELSLIRPTDGSYYPRSGLKLGMGWQLLPGLDMGVGLLVILRNTKQRIPYVQVRGSSHHKKAYGLYYSLSAGKGRIAYLPTDSRNYQFAELMLGARISHYGMLALGLKYSHTQPPSNHLRYQRLHFSAQLGIMLEGKDRSNPQNFDTAIEELYMYALTGLWRHKRADLYSPFWDGSLSFGYGYNFLPCLGLGFSASLVKGFDQPNSNLDNDLSLVGIGFHANITWKNWLLMLESGPMISATERYSYNRLDETFRKSKGLKPYMKMSFGYRLGRKKRLLLFMSFMKSTQMEGQFKLYDNNYGETIREEIVDRSISRIQLGTGIFLRSQ